MTNVRVGSGGIVRPGANTNVVRVYSVASTATLTLNVDSYDAADIKAQSEALVIANPSGTPTNMQRLQYRIVDDGTSQEITYGDNFRAVIGVTLPTDTLVGEVLLIKAVWNSTDEVWDVWHVSNDSIADLEQQIQAVTFNGNPYELYPENTSLIHGGYDGATTDTERTEVMQAWLTAGLTSGATNQIILRSIRNKIYTINSGISATGCAIIDSPGIIRASADMASGTLVTLTISGSSASTFNKITLLRVDGFNSTNPNTIEGCRIVNGQGVSKGLIHVYRCGTGFKAHNNVEACDFHIMHDSCDIAVHMGGDGGGGTTGDENHFLITGVSSDTLWKQDNATKSSAVVKFASEGGGSTNAAIEMSGAARAVFSGEIRGARKLFRGGGASVTFDNLQYYTDGAAIGENTIEFDAASGMIDGSIRISSTTASGGIWIKACASGSSLCIKQDDQVTGFGLKLGDFANSKLVTSFILTNGSSIRVDGTNSFIDLDYATRCEIDLSRIQGRATIGANSSLNELNIKAQALTLVNNRAELDNIIRFNEILTPAQRDALASPIKGYRIKGIVDTGMLIGEAHYNGSAWVQLG